MIERLSLPPSISFSPFEKTMEADERIVGQHVRLSGRVSLEFVLNSLSDNSIPPIRPGLNFDREERTFEDNELYLLGVEINKVRSGFWENKDFIKKFKNAYEISFGFEGRRYLGEPELIQDRIQILRWFRLPRNDDEGFVPKPNPFRITLPSAAKTTFYIERHLDLH